MNIIKGLIAGFIATIIITLLMLIKAKINFMVDLDIIHMVTLKSGGSPTIGFLIHFLIGTIGYGILFSFIIPFLKNIHFLLKGVILGSIAWFLSMTVAMPFFNNDLFVLNMGIIAPILTLLFHLVFGIVFIFVYTKLED